MFKLDSLLEDMEQFHSEYQQDNFITKFNGITLYGQYKQALREMKLRYTNLKNMMCDIELLKIEIEEYQSKKSEANDFSNRKLNVEIIKKNFILQDTILAYEETKTEFIRFYKQSCILKKEILIKYKVDEISVILKKQLEHEFWLVKLKIDALIDIINNKKLSQELHRTIISLPKEDRKYITDIIDSRDPQLILSDLDKQLNNMQSTFSDTLLDSISTDNLLEDIKKIETNIFNSKLLSNQ